MSHFFSLLLYFFLYCPMCGLGKRSLNFRSVIPVSRCNMWVFRKSAEQIQVYCLLTAPGPSHTKSGEWTQGETGYWALLITKGSPDTQGASVWGMLEML